MTFLSSGLKILLFEEGVTIERKYIKKRLLYLYPNLIKLAQQYRNGINSSALQFIKYFNR